MLEERFKIRRRMALSSYGLIVLLIFITLGIVILGTEQMSNNLESASMLLITLVGVLIGNVSHYNYMVYSIDKSEKKSYKEHKEEYNVK